MPDFVFTFDPTKPPGEKFSPELQAEIEFLAPSTLNDNAVSTQKMQDESVTNAKLAADAVHSENILGGEVKTVNLALSSVTTNRIADDAVTAAKAGLGVVTARDPNGADLGLYLVPISAVAHAAIVTPDPNAVYLILEA